MTTNSLKYTQSPEEFDGILEAVRQARTLFIQEREQIACISNQAGEMQLRNKSGFKYPELPLRTIRAIISVGQIYS